MYYQITDLNSVMAHMKKVLNSSVKLTKTDWREDVKYVGNE